MHDEIRKYIESKLDDEDVALSNDQELVTSGLLNSLKIIEMAMWLEQKYKITFAAQAFNVYDFNTIDNIEQLVRQKLAVKAEK
jgi:acyl carrier protein